MAENQEPRPQMPERDSRFDPLWLAAASADVQAWSACQALATLAAAVELRRIADALTSDLRLR